MMSLRWALAVLHLLGFGIGLGAIWARWRSLAATTSNAHALERAMAADNWWGLSALLLIGTGLARVFLGAEKPSGYYLQNQLFWIKMALVALILLLELAPMLQLLRWRLQQRRGQDLDLQPAGWMARVSRLQMGLLVAAMGLAAAMARGQGG